jgi:aspartate carbamoyltransferase catalytic subunit
LHSRVARSNALLIKKLGAIPVLVAPPTLMPKGINEWQCEFSFNLDEVIENVDAVMMLRVQQERMTAAYFPTAREYSRNYGLNSSRLKRMKKNALVLHPGPMNRGMEITAEVADSTNSVVIEQVANGVSVRMAVLYLLLGGSQSETESSNQ